MKFSLVPRSLVFAAVVALLATSTASAAKRSSKVAKKTNATQVELFEAMKSGEIEVRVIAKDSTTGNVLIRNKSDKPLSIKLPEVFAAVPVAAQFGGGMGGMGGMGGGMGGMGGMGGGMGGMGGGMQSMGGGMGGGGMGMGGGMGGMGGGMGGMGGGGGGFFNVEPEKVGKIRMVGLCLEHGKADPNPRAQYKLVPLETVTSDPYVAELVKMLVRGEIDQRSAQAAAWNLANGQSWPELAAKIGAKHLNGTTEPYFTVDQIQRAMHCVLVAQRRVEAAEEVSPGKSSSLSSAN
jgi:hypothetical protein